MTRLVFASLIVVTACGGKSKPAEPATGSAGSGAPAVYAKKVSLSWGIVPGQSADPMADVALQVTDETGKQIARSLGRYKGTCEVITPAPAMNAITGVACLVNGSGTELHAVKRSDEIVVVQMGVTAGVEPDPMAREQVSSVKIPVGVAVEGAK